MIIDDQEYISFAQSRAKLAYACGILHGTLETIKSVLTTEDVPLMDSITLALDEVSEILEAEFYPEWKKPPKLPKGEEVTK